MHNLQDVASKKEGSPLAAVRADFVPREHYTSVEFTRLENERLWPRVWQIACREEDLPRVGSFFTYTIVNRSVVLVRSSATKIQAFDNVCPHRGRELKSGGGEMTQFVCAFHGWRWNLEGKNIYVRDRADWDGCGGLKDADVGLTEVKVGTWGGWVFVNFDPKCVPFEEFIAPVPSFMNCLEFETMRYQWHKTFVLQANWKTALESFMESYHVPTTHPQALALVDYRNYGSAHGEHGKHTYYWERPPGAPSHLLNLPLPDDWREPVAAVFEFNAVQVGGGPGSVRSAQAVRRLMTELPANASYMEVIQKANEFCREAAAAEGAGWPTLTPELVEGLGADWNIFPNCVLVFGTDATLITQAWPNGDDPNSCIFSFSAIQRYGPGREPKIEREVLKDLHAEIEKIPPLLRQDLSNIEAVQRGIRSPAYRGARTNPKQEVQITHHHEVLRRYLFD